ncbi:hypothetical protein CPT_MarsHill_101 [Staphylococcus phage MarsHill]|nr:hypothetical protein CPT_MarsHill_101 [Staphylococcus phage MarsHill]
MNDNRTIKVIRKEILDEVQESIVNDRQLDKKKLTKLGEELIENSIFVLYTSDVDIYGVMLMTVEKIIDIEIPEPTFSVFDEEKGYKIGINPVLLATMVDKDEEIVSMFLHEVIHVAHGHLIEFRMLRNKEDSQLKMLSHLGMDLSVFEIEEDFQLGKREANTSKKVLPEIAPNVDKIEKYIQDKFNKTDFKLNHNDASHYYIKQLVDIYKENNEEDMFDSMGESMQNMIQEASEKQNERDEDSLNEENEMLKGMLEDLKDIEDKNDLSSKLEDNKLEENKVDDFENKAQEYINKLDEMNQNDEDNSNDTQNQKDIEEKMNDLLDSMRNNTSDNKFDSKDNSDLSDKIQEMKSDILNQMIQNNMQQGSQGMQGEDGGMQGGQNVSDMGSNMTMSSSLDGNSKHADKFDSNPLEGDATEERMKDQLYDLLESASSNSRGDTPAHIKEQIEILKRKPKIKWQDYLKAKVGKKRSSSTKTILRRNRRQPYRSDVRGTLPGRKLGKVFAAIDTSGSMGRNEIEEIIAELYYISSDMKIDLVLLFFSTDVEEVVEINRPNQFNDYVMGRGGTYFSSVFSFLNEKDNKRKYSVSKDDTLLFFSDGFGEPEVEYGVLTDVIWVITEDEDNLSVRDPKGKVLKLEVDNNR